MNGEKIGGKPGTCSTFFKTMNIFEWTFPWPTTMAREPLEVAIFLLRGHRL